MGQQSEIGARGFTLLELIVTLLIVAIAAGLVAPAIGRSTEAVRTRAEVAGFSATFRHAREQAITTQQPFAVVVNPSSRLQTVTTGEDEVRWALTVRFEPQGNSSGGEFRLSAGAVVYRVTIDAVTGRVKNRRE